MIPSKLDLLIWRGTSFELELVSQVKSYIYDSDVHNAPADLKRSHAENLKHYGYVYEYVDFAMLYTAANIDIVSPWKQDEKTPLMSLSLEEGHIALTNKSVQIGISAADTQNIEFDKGIYKLLLTTSTGKVDGLVYGEVDVQSENNNN